MDSCLCFRTGASAAPSHLPIDSPFQHTSGMDAVNKRRGASANLASLRRTCTTTPKLQQSILVRVSPGPRPFSRTCTDNQIGERSCFCLPSGQHSRKKSDDLEGTGRSFFLERRFGKSTGSAGPPSWHSSRRSSRTGLFAGTHRSEFLFSRKQSFYRGYLDRATRDACTCPARKRACRALVGGRRDPVDWRVDWLSTDLAWNRKKCLGLSKTWNLEYGDRLSPVPCFSRHGASAAHSWCSWS